MFLSEIRSSVDAFLLASSIGGLLLTSVIAWAYCSSARVPIGFEGPHARRLRQPCAGGHAKQTQVTHPWEPSPLQGESTGMPIACMRFSKEVRRRCSHCDIFCEPEIWSADPHSSVLIIASPRPLCGPGFRLSASVCNAALGWHEPYKPARNRSGVLE